MSAKRTPYLFTLHYSLLPLKRKAYLVTGHGMQHLSPVQVAALQTHDEQFRAGQVGGDGHIVLGAVADGLNHVGIVLGIVGVGVGEQQHQIDLVVGDAGVDLLMTALLVGKQHGHA